MLVRVGVLSLIAVATLFAAANVQVGWLYALGSLYVGLLVASLALSVSGLRRVAVRIRSDSVTASGQPLAVVAEVENLGVLARSFLALLASPLGEGRIAPLLSARRVPDGWVAAVVDRLEARVPVQVRLAIPANRRGVYVAPPIRLISSPLGLFTCWRTFRLETDVVVTPRIVPLSSLAWWPIAGQGGDDDTAPESPLNGGHAQPLRFSQSEASQADLLQTGDRLRSTREYRSGDSIRSVHWKGTARRGRLIVKETEGERHSGAIAVALDLLGNTDEGLEHAISVTASLLVHLGGAGRAVCLISQAGVVEGDLAGQLEALARVGRARDALVPWIADRDPTALVVVSAQQADWRSLAACWIQAAPAKARPLPGAIFCPVGCDVAGVLSGGAAE